MPEEIFPKIDWRNTENEAIRLAKALFDDNSYTYEALRKLEPLIRKAPLNSDLVSEFINFSIRNRAGWHELEHFQANGAFMGKHPILHSVMQFKWLKNLWKTDKVAFMDAYGKSKRTLDTYNSRLRTSKDKEYIKQINVTLKELVIKIKNMEKIAEYGK